MKKIITLKKDAVQQPTISVCELSPGARQFIVSIDGAIDESIYYAQLVHVLRTATEKDIIMICINTPGGCTTSGVMLISAIRTCKAVVHTHVVGNAFSCGAYIWGNGHVRTMGKYAQIMFHTSSHSDSGKTRDIKEASDMYEKMVVELIDELIEKQVLTEEDKHFMLVQKRDLFLYHNDFVTRYADKPGFSSGEITELRKNLIGSLSGEPTAQTEEANA